LIPEIIIINARWSLLLEKVRFNNGEGGFELGSSWEWEIPLSTDNKYGDIRTEIIKSIEMILNTGKTVILIYPIPEMGWDVSRILSRHLLINNTVAERVASISYASYLERNKSSFEEKS
jgi:hypothetical protein